jgi:iron-sulfur cluster assembly protein
MFSNFQPITITERAAEEVRKIMKTKGIPADYCLRIGVKGGGCGVSLLVGFDKPKETDQKFIIKQIPVIIDKKHTMYVTGKEMDYLQTEQGQGFSFIQRDDIKTNTNS